MNREELFAWVLNIFGVEPEYPWGDRNAVLRHGGNGKWFAAILEVGRDKLGLSGEGMTEVVNVKCDPRLIATLTAQEGFHRAYHMNKEKWVSIRLDGSVSHEEIETLVTMSYDLTGVKPPRNRSKV